MMDTDGVDRVDGVDGVDESSQGAGKGKRRNYLAEGKALAKAEAEARKAAALAAEREAIIAQAQAEGKAAPVKMSELPRDSYELLPGDGPEGCRQDCAHRGQAMDRGKLHPVCLKPSCFRKLTTAKEKAEKERERVK